MTFSRVEKSRERRDTRDASFPDAGCADVDKSGCDTFTRNAVFGMEVTTAVQHTAAVVASWPRGAGCGRPQPTPLLPLGACPAEGRILNKCGR